MNHDEKKIDDLAFDCLVRFNNLCHSTIMPEAFIISVKELLDGYEHPENFYRTVINSPEWELWTKHQEKLHKKDDYQNVFAVWDGTETGRISPQHFKAFLEFVKTLN